MEIQPLKKNIPSSTKQSTSEQIAQGHEARHREFANLIGDILKSLKMQGPELDLLGMMGSGASAAVRPAKSTEKAAGKSGLKESAPRSESNSSHGSEFELADDCPLVSEEAQNEKTSEAQQAADAGSELSEDTDCCENEAETAGDKPRESIESEATRVLQNCVKAEVSKGLEGEGRSEESTESGEETLDLADGTLTGGGAQPGANGAVDGAKALRDLTKGQTSEVRQNAEKPVTHGTEVSETVHAAQEALQNNPESAEKAQLGELVRNMAQANRGGDKQAAAEPSSQMGSFMATLAGKSSAQPTTVQPSGSSVLESKVTGLTEGGLTGGTLSLLKGGSAHGGEGLLGQGRKSSQSSGNAEKNSSANLVRANGTKLLEKVEQVLKEAAQSRDGKTIALRLDPPELGQLMVGISYRDGALHARVSAEQSSVQELLREKAADIHQVLRRLGLNVDKVSVSIGTEAFFASTQGDLGRENGSATGERGRSAPSPQQGDFGQGDAPESEEPRADDHWVA